MSNADIEKMTDPLARAQERLARHGWTPRAERPSETTPLQEARSRFALGAARPSGAVAA